MKQNKIIKKIRTNILKSTFNAQSSHIGSCFSSWLTESIDNSKIVSKSLSNKVISKIGSQKYLMNFLK